MDEILKKAAQAPHNVDSALLDRVAGSIEAMLKPVRPLPPTWVLTSGLILICAIVGLTGAARAGFFGIEKMDLLQRVLIFSTLAILAWLAGEEFASELIPGSRHRLTPGMLAGINCFALLAVFAFIFRDYHTDHFISAGFTCLFTGVLHAIPAGILSWLLLRRGFAVNFISAGLAGGALAGLAGVTLLELHCANFEAFHILVWHTAVVPVSAALGAAVAWMLQRNRLS
jgi:hypothetical protein